MSVEEHHRHGAGHAHLKLAVITASDTRTAANDQSGALIRELLENAGHRIAHYEILPDSSERIRQAVAELLPQVDGIVITGGTGIAARDVTPEATLAVCDRTVPGVAERMRAEGARKTSNAVLSRAVCGVRGTSLVLNLPGSPAAASESLLAVVEVLPHALELLAGRTGH